MAGYGTYQELLAQAIVDEMVLRGIGLGGGSSGGSGDASAANQVTQIDRITEIRNRLPFNGEFTTKPFPGDFYDHSGTIEAASVSQNIPLNYARFVGYFLFFCYQVSLLQWRVVVFLSATLG